MHFQTTRLKSLKNDFFIVWIVVKNEFLCISRPPESSPEKRLFLTSEVAENVFLCICAYFQTTRIKSLKNNFFHVWGGLKRAFMHLRILPDHQNQVLKKVLFSHLEWLKTCFNAFPDQQNQSP